MPITNDSHQPVPTESTPSRELYCRRIAAINAGLYLLERHLAKGQASGQPASHIVTEILTDDESLEPLSLAEIEALGAAINYYGDFIAEPNP